MNQTDGVDVVERIIRKIKDKAIDIIQNKAQREKNWGEK